MIPSVLSDQVQQGIEDFLRTTFPVATPFFDGLLDRFFERDGAVFKGPYLSLDLPFKEQPAGGEDFDWLDVEFDPYRHQVQAFERLRMPDPDPTIVATGTGSGKTEAFLYPILEHCAENAGDQGVKAILVYPMNALATDQSRRIARTISQNDDLDGRVTAGLYVGQQGADTTMTMTEERVITDRNKLKLQPPDLLLTNYKMLDYLLVRPDDSDLWQYNDPETLKYLVVDELHTFDGAQGTDLACLLRRLQARLDTPEEHLCPVGTSATLGSGEEKDRITGYAETVFGRAFPDDAVITEERKSSGRFLDDAYVRYVEPIEEDEAGRADPSNHDTREAYLRAQYRTWFSESPENDFDVDDAAFRTELGDALKQHAVFQNLLKILEDGPVALRQVRQKLGTLVPGFSDRTEEEQRNLVHSLLALISTARDPSDDAASLEEADPFLNVRSQLWLRELRRMVCSVEETPELAFADDLHSDQLEQHLPLVHCRECHVMGWAGSMGKTDTRVDPSLKPFYSNFFNNNPSTTFLFPAREKKQQTHTLCGNCMLLTEGNVNGPCPGCRKEADEKLVSVYVPDVEQERNDRIVADNTCPFCRSREGLTILGSRAASLTGVLITQLFSSTYNDDKNMLAFSDAVQDASHRASFFENRTYRFNVRTALQQFVEQAEDGVKLDDVSGGFIEYWKDRLPENEFVATFLPPDMDWMKEVQAFKEDGELPEEGELMEDIEDRIEWDVYSEYGFRARIGRTLERTGSSIAAPDPEKLDAAVEALEEPLRNEFGGLRDVSEQRLRAFLLGFMQQAKTKGGFYLPVLDRYLHDWGKHWLLHKIPWLPNFGSGTRTPAFPTTKAGIDRFDKLLTGNKPYDTWYEAWAKTCFHEASALISSRLNDLYQLVLDTFTDHDLLRCHWMDDHRVWTPLPSAFRVTTDVVALRCGECGTSSSVPAVYRDVIEDLHCLRYHCSGRYSVAGQSEEYYAKLYREGDVQRIYAEEHTSLLDSDRRQELEERFEAKEHPWDPNLLSCTPTLELGVDIGNLSSIVLCSVPPSRSNYLQRIGRSGREDGNALNITVANGRAHDLYFYAEPEQMIDGEIEPPGAFLNAPMVLERQFVAYCFDCWVRTGITDEELPSKLKTVLDDLDDDSADEFPGNFHRYIENNLSVLLDGFFDLMGEDINAESRAYLERFAKGGEREGGLEHKIIQGLNELSDERSSLQSDIKGIRREIRNRNDEPAKSKNHEEDIDELQQEKSALQSVVREIDKKNTFNFFTDEGLLPNYAFPESGVTLKSIIYRKTDEADEDGGYEFDTYEYERPAVSAIHELAPENEFYGEKRCVEIDRIDLDVSDREEWRFCPRCPHMKLEARTGEQMACPKCGDTSWGDVGQINRMVRMKQVYANTSARDSRSGMDREDRRPVFYEKEMLVNFEEQAIAQSYHTDAEDCPFGVEFLEDATFREINFGKREGLEFKNTKSIAGVSVPESGFAVCEECGTVQTDPDEPDHTRSCRARRTDHNGDLVDYLYLYREFSSEALRILLPVTSMGPDSETVHSFVAALQLGMKERFHGSVDHISSTIYEEPIEESEHSKKYLMLYDRVPGGTGYLKDILNTDEPLMDVLEAAQEVMTSCPCREDPEKDGCYRCLYAYRNSYDMEDTSRDRATNLIGDILEYRDQLEEIDTLSEVPVNTLFDSELEARFVEAIRRQDSDQRDVQLVPQVVNQKEGYFLTVGEVSYEVEPQVELGTNDGVSVPSRADFVIRPARRREGQRPIAVFADGFEFHRDRIGNDLLQRMALINSGRYRVWSLSWNDVQQVLKTDVDAQFKNFLPPNIQKLQKLLNRAEENKGREMTDFIGVESWTSFDLLIRYLADPDPEKWERLSCILALLYIDSDEREAWIDQLREAFPDRIAESLLDRLPADSVQGHQFLNADQGYSLVNLFAFAGQDGVSRLDPEAVSFAAKLIDPEGVREREEFEDAWNGYLRILNLFQFLEGSILLSETATESEQLIDLDLSGQLQQSDQRSEEDEWEEVYEFTTPDLHDLIDGLQEADTPVPNIAHELQNDRGRIVASAELAWPDRTLACLHDGETPYEDEFLNRDWTVLHLSDVKDRPEQLLEKLE